MRRWSRFAVLASSMAVTTSGFGGSAAHADNTAPIPNCSDQLAAPSSSVSLAVTIGHNGTAIMQGQGTNAQHGALTYHFDFGDGSTLTQSSPTVSHVYDHDASFGPVVTVTDANGVSATSAECSLNVIGVPNSVQRFGGASRYQTATAISQKLWAGASGDNTAGRRQAKAVVLASGEGFADALAGTPLAAYKQGPLLLTASTELTKDTETEIQRILPPGSTVYILGGTSAVSPTVDAKLRADGYQTTRYGGGDRYATAMLIATHGLDNPASTIVVTGQDFPDGLAAGPVATSDTFSTDGKPAAIMLSNGDHITDQATAAFVKARLGLYLISGPHSESAHVLALGGQAFCAVYAVDGGPGCDSTMKHFASNTYANGLINYAWAVPGKDGIGHDSGGFMGLSGMNRYETAAAVAHTGITGHSNRPDAAISGAYNERFGLASGDTYPDALTGAAAMATLHTPILLTKRDYFPPATLKFLTGIPFTPRYEQTVEADIFGGPGAISTGLEAQLVVGITQ